MQNGLRNTMFFFCRSNRTLRNLVFTSERKARASSVVYGRNLMYERPNPTPWRFWESYISGTAWPIHERSSLSDVTIQYILYLTDTDTRRCLPRHAERAEWEGVGDTLPSITSWRLTRMRSNFACVYRPAGYYFNTSQSWGGSARAHVHTPFPYLANDWADYVQIWYVARGPLDKRFTQGRDGMHLHLRTCTPLFHTSRTA